VHVRALGLALSTADPFDPPTIEAVLRKVAEERGLKAAALIHPTRIAVTGQAVGPGLFDVVAVLGRARTVARLQAFEQFLRSAGR
jgi:glutamyl-tRNA synthetase